MKVALNVYAHAENGMSIQLMPETEFESAFLKSFASGETKFSGEGHPCDDKISPCGYRIKVLRGDKRGG
jgi:hypothetical protein